MCKKTISFLIALCLLMNLFNISLASSEHWAESSISNLLKEKQLLGSDQDMTGMPFDDPISRGDFINTLIGVLFDIGDISSMERQFTDIIKYDKYYDATYYAKKAGIINGYPDGNFKPNDTIKREEAFTVVGRALSAAGIKSVYPVVKLETEFKDQKDISPYAENYIAVLVTLGIINGFEDQTIRPKSLISIGESMWVITKIHKIVKNEYADLYSNNYLSTLIDYSDITSKPAESEIDRYVSLGGIKKIIIASSYADRTYDVEGEEMLAFIDQLRSFQFSINKPDLDRDFCGNCSHHFITICYEDGTSKKIGFESDFLYVSAPVEYSEIGSLYFLDNSDREALEFTINNIRLKGYRQSGLPVERGEIIKYNETSRPIGTLVRNITVRRDDGSFFDFKEISGSGTEMVLLATADRIELKIGHVIEIYFKDMKKESKEILFILGTRASPAQS